MKKSDWVSVDEELPEYGAWVLVCNTHGDIGITERRSWTYDITHWQPLPDPPDIGTK